MSAVEHLPGVMDVEPIRSVPVRLRAGPRSRTLAITGLPETPRLNRIVNRNGRVLSLPADGLVLSTMLGRDSRCFAGRPGPGRGPRGAAVRAAGPGRSARRRQRRTSGLHADRCAARHAPRRRRHHRRGRDARPGRDWALLCGREGRAGHCRRRSDGRHAPEFPRHDGARTCICRSSST